MTIEDKNGLKEPYTKYQLRQIRVLCNQIPKERREELITRIKVYQFANGNGNKKLLTTAIKLLKRETK